MLFRTSPSNALTVATAWLPRVVAISFICALTANCACSHVHECPFAASAFSAGEAETAIVTFSSFFLLSFTFRLAWVRTASRVSVETVIALTPLLRALGLARCSTLLLFHLLYSPRITPQCHFVNSSL